MKISAFLAAAATALSVLANALYPSALIKALAITFATVSYHLIMRLACGTAIGFIIREPDPYAARYRVSVRETKLYELLGMRRWKGSIPSYSPQQFDFRLHSWQEIARAMCRAEALHEAIALLSLAPIFAGLFFGEWAVFIITSLAAAGADLTLAAVQRYNRPKMLRLLDLLKRCEKHKQT